MDEFEIQNLKEELDSFRQEKEKIRRIMEQVGGARQTKQDVVFNVIFLSALGLLFILDISRHMFHLPVPLPTMFSIILQNPGGRWTDDARFQEGKLVEISAEGEDGAVLLCKGKITAIEPELTGGHQNLTLRGYDLSYGLYRNRHRRSYIQMTDSDIVRRIAQEVGLQAEVENTSQVHEYIFQNNLTHMEFLRERSKMIGFELFVEGERLCFRSPPPSSEGSPIPLQWGRDFTEFHPKLSVAEQVNEVTVKGWNPAQKSEIIGRATRGEGAPAVGEHRSGGSVAEGIWGRAIVQISDRPVASQAQADKMAQAILNEKESKFITAQGSCRGNPQIKPGKILEISGVGNRFSETIFLRATRAISAISFVRLSMDRVFFEYFTRIFEFFTLTPFPIIVTRLLPPFSST